MKVIKKILISIGIAAGVCILAFGVFLLLAQILEYKPAPVELLSDIGNQAASLQDPQAPPSTLRLFSWNIGYCGLNAAMDFVMEGGKGGGRAAGKQTVEANLEAMLGVSRQADYDVLFIQETDRPSMRSFGVDEVGGWLQAYPQFSAWYALNFKVFFVPYPLPDAIGQVQSGILTLGRFPATYAARYQLPGLYAWPVGLVNLKRCMLVSRFPSATPGKDWVLINQHLDAYDATGNLRKEQLEFIKTYVLELFAQGHYVVIGGDWNSVFPGVAKDRFGPYNTSEINLFWVQNIPVDWTPQDWQWAFDARTATCRSLEQPYVPGENFVTVIDGFLVSPNIDIVEIETLDLKFTNTDHNPVHMTVRIR